MGIQHGVGNVTALSADGLVASRPGRRDGAIGCAEHSLPTAHRVTRVFIWVSEGRKDQLCCEGVVGAGQRRDRNGAACVGCHTRERAESTDWSVDRGWADQQSDGRRQGLRVVSDAHRHDFFRSGHSVIVRDDGERRADKLNVERRARELNHVLKAREIVIVDPRRHRCEVEHLGVCRRRSGRDFQRAVGELGFGVERNDLNLNQESSDGIRPAQFHRDNAAVAPGRSETCVVGDVCAIACRASGGRARAEDLHSVTENINGCSRRRLDEVIHVERDRIFFTHRNGWNILFERQDCRLEWRDTQEPVAHNLVAGEVRPRERKRNECTTVGRDSENRPTGCGEAVASRPEVEGEG